MPIFIKLTLRDGSPVWIQVRHITTLMDSNGEGAFVSFPGDDVRVRESAEDVIGAIMAASSG